MSGEEVVTTPRTTPKPSYKPPETTTPTPSYLPPIGEGDSDANPNRQGKKLTDFVKLFNTKASKNSNEKRPSNEGKDKIKVEDRDEEKDDDDEEDDGEEDEDNYSEEIGEDFVDALADNYYYDYDNQEIKPKNNSKTGKSQQVNPESSSVQPVTEKIETKNRSKNRKSKEGRRQEAEERSDRIDEKVEETKETIDEMKDKDNENSLIFEKTIPSKVKKLIDSSVRSDRKGNVKVARAKGEEANRSVILSQFEIVVGSFHDIDANGFFFQKF